MRNHDWIRDKVLEVISLLENGDRNKAYHLLSTYYFPEFFQVRLDQAVQNRFWVTICDVLDYGFLCWYDSPETFDYTSF